VRTEVGATSTILTEYLQASGIEPTTPLATALFYGIKTDTMGLGRGASPADAAAYFYLQPRIDVDALVEIERAQLPAEYFQSFVTALQAARVYDGVVLARSRNSLHGRAAFTGSDSLTATGPHAWRVDVLVLPDRAEPARLRLRLASDERITNRGWIIARLESLAQVPASAFPVAVLPATGIEPQRLVWDWNWEPVSHFSVETSLDHGLSWRNIWELPPGSGGDAYARGVPVSDLAAGLATSLAARNLVRVVAHVSFGRVASRPFVLYRDGGASGQLALGRPYPNPATGPVRFMAGEDVVHAEEAVHVRVSGDVMSRGPPFTATSRCRRPSSCRHRSSRSLVVGDHPLVFRRSAAYCPNA